MSFRFVHADCAAVHAGYDRNLRREMPRTAFRAQWHRKRFGVWVFSRSRGVCVEIKVSARLLNGSSAESPALIKSAIEKCCFLPEKFEQLLDGSGIRSVNCVPLFDLQSGNPGRFRNRALAERDKFGRRRTALRVGRIQREVQLMIRHRVGQLQLFWLSVEAKNWQWRRTPANKSGTIDLQSAQSCHADSFSSSTAHCK